MCIGFGNVIHDIQSRKSMIQLFPHHLAILVELQRIKSALKYRDSTTSGEKHIIPGVMFVVCCLKTREMR